jgi:alpha-beta hydrolase superfamily lysophospholipase
VVNPENIKMPTIVMRGEYDGIAGIDDLLAFFAKLPVADKEFTVMPGISHASFQQKNYLMVYQLLAAFLERPEPVYRGQ